jgi:putative thioredoxin
MTESRSIVDVGDLEFARAVLDRSRELPVIVDFWAPWCGPCRNLGPVLERLAIEQAGSFVLAKVNVDEAPQTAQTFGIQSIPAVKAFRDGKVVAEFVGAQPEPAVRAFLARILPNEADRLATDGESRAAAGDAAGAGHAFREALGRDARHPRALLGLARLHVDDGKPTEALQLLERIPVGSPVSRDADRLAARIRMGTDLVGDEATLRHRVAANLTDLDARFQLARLLAAREKYDDALAELLEVVRRDPRFADEAPRRTMLDIFELLGPADPLTQRYRSELAQALFR